MSDGILIVCGQKDFGDYLMKIVASVIAGHHSVAHSGSDARRRTSMSQYPAILIVGRLSDEEGLDLALDLAQGDQNGVMIVVERDELAEAHEVLDGTGAIILSKPLTKDALLSAIRLIMKVSEGGGTLEKAKLMLMQQKGWTEPQAHRYIQKLSMDKRLPREVAAQMVIKALDREREAR